MSCPTCSHTMQAVTTGPVPIFWCPRCGTLKGFGNQPPTLVDSCRNFEEDSLTEDLEEPWLFLGIAESIRPENERSGQ